jgi:hypothetical protein
VSKPHIHTHIHAPDESLQARIQRLANYAPMGPLGSIYTYTHAPGEQPDLRFQGPSGAQAGAGEAPDIHTHTPIHTHEKEHQNDSPMSQEPEGTRREVRMILGKQAEERMAEILSIFGEVELGLGTNGEPDLLLETSRGHYAIEVKTMLPMHRSKQPDVNGYQVNRVTLELAAWEALGHYAEEHDMARILAVEVRIRGGGRGHLYHVILGEMVDQLAKPGSRWVGFSIYDLPAISWVSLRPGIPYTGRAQL